MTKYKTNIYFIRYSKGSLSWSGFLRVSQINKVYGFASSCWNINEITSNNFATLFSSSWNNNGMMSI
jgi:hypothetical protein